MMGDPLGYVVKLSSVHSFCPDEFSRHLRIVSKLPASEPVQCKFIITNRGLYTFTATDRLSHEQFWWRCGDSRLVDAGYVRLEEGSEAPKFVLSGWPEILHELGSPGQCARLRSDLLRMGWDKWFLMEL